MDSIKGLYDDLFGENQQNNEKKSINGEDDNKEFMKASKDSIIDNIQKSSNKIDELIIDTKSKENLKRIIEYIKKYNEGAEQTFLSFNMCIYTKNSENLQDILRIDLITKY